MVIGWFALKRGTLDHELFKPEGRWTKFEAWVWLIESAAYEAKVIDIGGKPFEVKRGQLAFSERFLASKWGWSQKAVQTFLAKLSDHGAIEVRLAKTGSGTKSKRTLITLCNYERYQHGGIKTESKGNQNGIKEEQVTNIPPTEGAPAPALRVVDAGSDPVAVLFRAGRELLAEAGINGKQAGNILGKWRRDHGDAAVITALGRAKREGAIEPVAFIEGCFRASTKAKQPQSGDTRITPDGIKQVFVSPFDGWVREYA